jgi:tetratricopeptide (TPR) repeat protein
VNTAAARRQAAQLAAEARPGDPQAWVDLSQACLALFDYESAIEAARRAVAAAPESAPTMRHLANTLMDSGYGIAEARDCYERVLAAAPDDAAALLRLYYFAIADGDCARALSLAQATDRAYPGDAQIVARVARAHELLGDWPNAVAQYRRAESLCESAGAPFPDSPNAALKPVFARAAGDLARSEALSEQLCRAHGAPLANVCDKRYPGDCLERIARLRDHVAGRDIYLFGFGPSLQDLVNQKSVIAGRDFAAMSLTTFPVIEDSILRDFGRRIDIACLTHPRPLDQLAAAIRERASQAPPFFLALPLCIRDGAEAMGNRELLDDRTARIVWFEALSELPPSPRAPLDFPGINTLSCALAVAVLARPRRIFLFGFDGKIRGEDPQAAGSLYFGEEDSRYHAPARRTTAGRQTTKSWLWWDSRRFNETAPVTLRHVALLFDMPLPPIYTVCPDSALEPFPRISMAQFAELISERGLSPP